MNSFQVIPLTPNRIWPRDMLVTIFRTFLEERWERFRKKYTNFVPYSFILFSSTVIWKLPITAGLFFLLIFLWPKKLQGWWSSMLASWTTQNEPRVTRSKLPPFSSAFPLLLFHICFQNLSSSSLLSLQLPCPKLSDSFTPLSSSFSTLQSPPCHLLFPFTHAAEEDVNTISVGGIMGFFPLLTTMKLIHCRIHLLCVKWFTFFIFLVSNTLQDSQETQK